MKHRPKGDKPWPKPKEVYPWLPQLADGGDLTAKENQDKIYKLHAVSALGAICCAAGTPPDAEVVQDAITRCNTALAARSVPWPLEVWNDALTTFKSHVVELLQEA